MVGIFESGLPNEIVVEGTAASVDVAGDWVGDVAGDSLACNGL
jgi:hypothetical protein